MSKPINQAPTPIAIGIVLNSEQEILVSYRTADRDLGDHWEFPGGKVEQGESVAQALTRELKEEVDLMVAQAQPLLRFDFCYGNKTVDLNVWLVEHFTGKAKGQEGQAIQWVDLNALKSLKTLPANARIITAISDLLSNSRQQQR